MFKITWGKRSDRFSRSCIICPDVEALFDAWFVITGYGRDDGCTPINVEVSNLDGVLIDMTKGLADAAGRGTR